jgi:hypothetical protein
VIKYVLGDIFAANLHALLLEYYKSVVSNSATHQIWKSSGTFQKILTLIIYNFDDCLKERRKRQHCVAQVQRVQKTSVVRQDWHQQEVLGRVESKPYRYDYKDLAE